MTSGVRVLPSIKSDEAVRRLKTMYRDKIALADYAARLGRKGDAIDRDAAALRFAISLCEARLMDLGEQQAGLTDG